MKIIGIDPGTARMGYSIVHYKKDKPILVESACIITLPEMEMQDRLQLLYQTLERLVTKHAPEVMIIERLFFNTNAKTAIAVGQARGVSLLVAANHKLKVTEYTALEAKKAISGSGKSDKKMMQQAVKDYLKLDEIIKSDDANDAVALALCHLHKLYAVITD